ncbi:MAG: Hsp20/alpha crystallin family protein [Phycisphaerae bacterium]
MSFGKFGQSAGFDEWTRKIHDIMDEMQKRDFVRFRHSGTWQPATNVYETREAFYICVELAGVHEQQIDVECVERTRITIKGSRAQPRPDGVEGPLSIHAMEIDDGPFLREIDLPEPIDVDALEATYSEGYLWVTAPRTTTG